MMMIVSVWVTVGTPGGGVFCAQITYFQKFTRRISVQNIHSKWLAAKIPVFSELALPSVSLVFMKKPDRSRVFVSLFEYSWRGKTNAQRVSGCVL